jgi:hypothetical protein
MACRSLESLDASLGIYTRHFTSLQKRAFRPWASSAKRRHATSSTPETAAEPTCTRTAAATASSSTRAAIPWMCLLRYDRVSTLIKSHPWRSWCLRLPIAFGSRRSCSRSTRRRRLVFRGYPGTDVTPARLLWSVEGPRTLARACRRPRTARYNTIWIGYGLKSKGIDPAEWIVSDV